MDGEHGLEARVTPARLGARRVTMDGEHGREAWVTSGRLGAALDLSR